MEDLVGEKERLANLVRDLQSRSRESLPTQDQTTLRRRVLKGGMLSKERSFTRVSVEDLPRLDAATATTDNNNDDASTGSEKVYPRVSFSPVNNSHFSSDNLVDTAEEQT